MTDEQHAQVVQDNLRLIDRNRDLETELALCKQKLGKLKAESHKPEDMTTCSAYDLLSEKDRETLRWVREHSGLQEVSNELAYGREVSGRVGIALYGTEDNVPAGLTPCKLEEELRKRLMPEGYVWPRYEDGEPVRIDGEFMGKDGKTYTAKQIQFIGKCFSLFDFCDSKPQFGGFYGERVKLPAILAADGEKIEIGQSLYGVESGIEYIVDGFVTDGSHENYTVKSYMAYGQEVMYIDPKMVTHRKQVFSADGEPLEVGQTVYHIADGCEYRVVELLNGGAMVEAHGKPTGRCRADYLTHQRPVLDADGVPIREGDTVWDVNDGKELEVVSADCTDGMVILKLRTECGGFTYTATESEHLTHTKPEPPDTWEKIEEDAFIYPKFYCEEHGIGATDDDELRTGMISDLVRRCKALAGVSE